MSGGLYLILATIILLVIGVPVAFSLGIASLSYIVLFNNILPISFFTEAVLSSTSSFTLVAIPFFILAGELMLAGKISEKLIDFCMAFTKKSTTALGMVTIAACAIFAAISGSGAATVACIGGIMIPQMVRNGYDRGYATALATSSGALGPIIPPSLTMIIYAVTVQVSVSDMFLCGFIPGILMAVVLCLVARYSIKKAGYKPSEEVARENEAKGNKTLGAAFKEGIWALLMPIIILGGIYGGIFTPTEAAVVACVYAIIIGMFVYKSLSLKSLPAVLIKTGKSCSFLILISICGAFGKLLAMEGITTAIENFVLGITDNKYLILLMLNILLLIVGMFLDAGPAIVLLAPIFAPIVSAVGVNLLHFGIIMCINLAIGLVTPPVGVNLFVGMRTGNVSMEKLVPHLKLLLPAMIIVLLIITYVPAISLFLPNII